MTILVGDKPLRVGSEQCVGFGQELSSRKCFPMSAAWLKALLEALDARVGDTIVLRPKPSTDPALILATATKQPLRPVQQRAALVVKQHSLPGGDYECTHYLLPEDQVTAEVEAAFKVLSGRSKWAGKTLEERVDAEAWVWQCFWEQVEPHQLTTQAAASIPADIRVSRVMVVCTID